jgi:hypothetical protein
MARTPRLRHAHRLLLVGCMVVGLAVVGTPLPASASLIGELSGTVTGGGTALPNVWVTYTPVTEAGDPRGNPQRTLTDVSGRYEFPEVYDQNIKVQVRAPLFGEFVDTYWPEAHTFTQAGILEISDWPVRADIDLPVGGSVSGRVVDIATGAPVPGAQVSAMITASPGSGAVGFTSRDRAPGEFAISGLPPVPLMLRVRLPSDSRYLAAGPGERFEGVAIDGAATTSGVTVGLRRGAEIRGTVRDDAGVPVEGALIKVVGCMPNCPLIVSSEDSGAYQIVGVSPGSRLGVVAWKGDQLVRQWYPGRDNASRANDIALEPGDTIENVDFALSRAAFMTVPVTGADSGDPLPGAIVLLVSSTDSFERHYALRSKEGPGRMRLGPLHPGSYRLTVMPGATNPGYAAVDRATSTGIAPEGIIELGPEDDVEFAVELPRLPGSQDPSAGGVRAAGTVGAGSSNDGGGRTTGCRTAPANSDAPDAGTNGSPTGWPGLAPGFLATSAEASWPW